MTFYNGSENHNPSINDSVSPITRRGISFFDKYKLYALPLIYISKINSD